MTQLDHARLLYRKACQDRAILTHIVGEPEIDDDAVGFHVQQAIEKLLKSALAARRKEWLSIVDDLSTFVAERLGE